MKQVLFTMMMLPLFAKSDAVYDTFIALKTEGIVERNAFYHNLSNNMAIVSFQWQGDEWGGTLTATNICSVITNVECDVDLVKVSTNVVSTNLTCVSRHFRGGDIHRFRYHRNGNLSMIETIGSRLGDFNIYQIDTNGELNAYIAATNFVGVHNVRQYQNGTIIREAPPPTEFFQLLKESQED